MPSYEASEYNKIIRQLYTIEDLQEYDMDRYYVYYSSVSDDSISGQALGTVKQFFKRHYQIYDVMRFIATSLTNISKEYGYDLNFIPYKRFDEITKGTINKSYITYEIESIFPGKISQDDKSRREYAPRERYQIRTLDGMKYPSTVAGQFIDNYIRFKIFGRTVTETEELMVFFRHFMHIFAGGIQNNGVAIIRFEEGGTMTSALNHVEHQGILYLDYLIRTEDLYVTYDPIIKLIELATNVVGNQNTEEQ